MIVVIASSLFCECLKPLNDRLDKIGALLSRFVTAHNVPVKTSDLILGCTISAAESVPVMAKSCPQTRPTGKQLAADEILQSTQANGGLIKVDSAATQDHIQGHTPFLNRLMK